MVYTEKQQQVLLAAWKLGHLLNNKNYGTISEISGLSRKQISNYSRKRIKRSEKPDLLKSYVPLRSIIFELPKEMRTDKDYSTLLAADAAVVSPELHMKRRNTWITETNNHSASKRRKVLLKAWERGCLSDKKYYASISEITGLSRKQISNYARSKIKKHGKIAQPKKSPETLRTIFKELSQCMREDSTNVATHIGAKDHQQVTLNIAKNCNQEFVSSAQSDQPFLPRDTLVESPISKRTFPRIKCQSLQNESLQCATILSRKTSVVKVPESPRSADVQKLSTSPVSVGKALKHAHLLRVQISKTYTISISSIFISPIDQWVIKNALKGINELFDPKVESLAILTSTSYNDIIQYLLHNGWNPKPADPGVRYVRMES